jgi:4-diphosphocytidyl-2-C-methyl-D-erythritol kinase
VTGRRPDGYHLLDSLVCFPGVADRLEAEPAHGLSLALDGPFGDQLAAEADNLVLRAAALLRPPGRGAALRLAKHLPVAAGLGGGSSDAAAAIRVLARLWEVPLPAPERLVGIGADVPVCLAARPARMRGIGERLTPVAFPDFWLVLVNPGVPLSTAAVFGVLASRDNAPLPEPPVAFRGAGALADWLALARNDLEAPACTIEPRIRSVLDALAARPGCRLARMSGSGASCFGLFAREVEARAAGAALRCAEPAWWVAAAPGALPPEVGP